MTQESAPGLTTHDFTEREPFKLRQPGTAIEGPPVQLDATNILAETGAAAPYRLKKGTVLMEPSSGSKWLLASGTQGTRKAATAPSVSSAEAVDGDWTGKVLTLYVDGKQVAQVTLSGVSDTSGAVTALNGDSDFADHATASGTNGNPLVITGHDVGAGHSIKASVNLDTAYATDTGSDSEDEDHGTTPDVRVMKFDQDLKNDKHEDYDAFVPNYIGGVFDASVLRKGWATTGISSAARAHMERRGLAVFL